MIAAALAIAATGLAGPARSQTEILWTFEAGEPPEGTPAAATGGLPNLAVGALNRGNSGNTALLQSSSPSNYEGASGNFNAAAAARGGPLNPDENGSAWFEVTLEPAAGYRVTWTAIAFGSRSTGTGPQAYSIRTSVDGFATEVAGGFLENDGVWRRHSHAALTISSAGALSVRIYGYDGTATTSANNWRIDDLKLTAAVSPVSAPPPQILSFEPSSGTQGTAVTIRGANFGATPSVSFHGTAAAEVSVNAAGTEIVAIVPAGAATGPLTVTGPGGAVSSSGPFTVIAQPTISLVAVPAVFPENGSTTCELTLEQASGTAVTVTLTSSHPAEATVPATVVVPPGETTATFPVTGVPDNTPDGSATVVITASAPGYDTGSTTVTVTNVDARPTTVVINKYLNSPDLVELLVIADGTAGSVVDMRGMLLKDFSGSMNGDGGGKFRFLDVPLLAAMRAGTLIVLSGAAESPDPDPSDYVVRLGLNDPDYFTAEGGSFDIATTEMVMIKSAGSPAAGTAGAIHTLAGGSPGAWFADAGPPKLIAEGTSGTGFGVIANNSTESLADFHGTDATGGVPLTADDFGLASGTANRQFIRRLRGVTTTDGAGAGVVTNTTPGSPLHGCGFLLRNQTGQRLTVTISLDVSPGTLETVRLTIPEEFGSPAADGIEVSGPGARAPAVAVTGQDITIGGLAVTAEESVSVAIAGLVTPDPSGPAADGRYVLPLATAAPSGSLTPVAAPPVVLVTIPIAAIRDTDAAGRPVDLRKTVAVEGVCTAENFDPERLSAYIQDATAGVNVFANSPVGLTRGHRYAVAGQVLQFSGLTEIAPPDADHIVPLGPGVEPPPVTLTIAEILADPERYEGMLVRIAGVTDAAQGSWAVGQTLPVLDGASGDLTLDIRIQPGSTAEDPPPFPAIICGILGQYDTTTPFTEGYQLQPRDPADLAAYVPTAYDSWAAGHPGIGGPRDDADGDGIPNLLEYALNGNPRDPSSPPAPLIRFDGTTFSLAVRPDAAAAALVTIEHSTDLLIWRTDTIRTTLADGELTGAIDATASPGFLRVRATINP